MESIFLENYYKLLKLGVVSEIDFNVIVFLMKFFYELYLNIEM